MSATDDDKTLDFSEQQACKFCLREKSQYTCPRCNVRYCSLSCYKCSAHANCSESFYRDCFMEGLKDMKSPDDRTKVLAMLKRVSEQQDPLESDDEDDDLHERMQGLDLDKDSDLIWSRLTDKEKAEFKSLVQDGRISQLISVWQPWWLKSQKPSLVQEVNSANGDSVAMTALPPIISAIPEFSSLIKGKSPAENVRYSIINIIYGYAYISRLYNGDYRDYPEECAQELLRLCPAFGKTTYNSVAEAIQSCIDCLAIQAKSLYVSHQFTVSAVRDTQEIIHGPGTQDPVLYTAAALSELHHLFTDGMKIFSKALKRRKLKDSPSGTIGPVQSADVKQLKHQCFCAVKKLEFLLSWLQEFGFQLQELEPMLQVEFCEMSSRLAEHTNTETHLEKLRENMNRKSRHRLVEELSMSNN